MSDLRYVPVPDWITVKVSGPELMDYLNGIITRDLEQIEENEYHRSAFLTPTGKIRSIFWLRMEGGSVYMHAPPSFKQNLVEDLLKYKLSLDVKLEDITQESDPLYLVESDRSIEGLHSNSFHFSFTNSPLPPGDTELTYQGFEQLLIEQGVIPPSFGEGHNPYELGFADIISLEKGCFLGQEPISRMYYRGNPRKYVYHLQTSQSGPIHDAEGEEVGEILVSGADKALGYIRRQTDDLTQLSIENT
ncbi:MAG: CAF17-like 4Fe-4S cluster assembly/insertion protein YgfZ, partial [Candidatus Kariarchaeaceae archaeon]